METFSIFIVDGAVSLWTEDTIVSPPKHAVTLFLAV